MINEPTVLILGAGASMPYKFPSGVELRNLICGLSNLGNENHQFLVQQLECDSGELRHFARTFHGSNIKSIDAFLARRPEFTAFGKLSIATLLCQTELPKRVIPGDAENNPDDHWYYYLWNVLVEEANTVDEFIGNQIRFITFNYDRSLEYFLHTSIKNTYGVSEEDALAILGKIPILHVYGCLGEFHFLTGVNRRQFSNDIDAERIRIATTAIKVIPEDREYDPFLIARQWCYEANKIGFLGFGFDVLNIERLGLKDVLDRRYQDKHDRPLVVASAYDKTQAERNHYQSLVSPRNPWDAFDRKCTRTLRESGLLH
jgi:hypothetical protein